MTLEFGDAELPGVALDNGVADVLAEAVDSMVWKYTIGLVGLAELAALFGFVGVENAI